jgi:hypothetical protein
LGDLDLRLGDLELRLGDLLLRFGDLDLRLGDLDLRLAPPRSSEMKFSIILYFYIVTQYIFFDKKS